MIATPLIYTVKQLFYDKNIMFERKKTFRYSEIQDSKSLKGIIKFRNYLLVLIFRSSHSQMVFKIGVLKNIHRNTPVLALAGLRLKNIYDGCLSIFVAANPFFHLNLVFQPLYLLHRFLFRTSLKTRVKRQKWPRKLFCKKMCSEKFCKFYRKTLC